MVERVSGDFAMMAIVGEGARTRPDPWPSLGIVTIDPDAYFGSASLLEGEQNIDLPRMGSEQDDCRMLPNQHAIIRWERVLPLNGTPSKPVAPEPLKPPDLPMDDLEKSGGASALDDSSMLHGGGPGDLDSLGLAWTVADMEARKVEPSDVDAHEQGGALPVVGAAPALAEGTAGVEPAGEAEKATAAKPEALVPWAQGMAEREVEMLPGEGKPSMCTSRRLRCCRERASTKPRHLDRRGRTHCRGEHMPEVRAREGRRKPEALQPDGEREHGTTPQNCPNKGDRKPS